MFILSKNQYIIKTNSVIDLGLRFSDFMPANYIPRKSIDLYKMDLKNNLENDISCTDNILAGYRGKCDLRGMR